LVAGKGHERLQKIAGNRFVFSDQDHIRLAIKGSVMTTFLSLEKMQTMVPGSRILNATPEDTKKAIHLFSTIVKR
jgi:hypothetical protein